MRRTYIKGFLKKGLGNRILEKAIYLGDYMLTSLEGGSERSHPSVKG
jgi:hypothetical protein